MKDKDKISPIVFLGITMFFLIMIIGLVINYLDNSKIFADNLKSFFFSSYLWYVVTFFVGTFIIERIIRSIFPNKGKILTYLSSFPILGKYSGGPKFLVLFGLFLALAYKFNASAWIYVLILIIITVTYLRIIDTSK